MKNSRNEEVKKMNRQKEKKKERILFSFEEVKKEIVLIEKELKQLVSMHDLTIMDYRLLNTLDSKKAVPLVQVTKEASLYLSTAIDSCRALEEKKLIYTKQMNQELGVYLVGITKQGTMLVEVINEKLNVFI